MLVRQPDCQSRSHVYCHNDALELRFTHLAFLETFRGKYEIAKFQHFKL